MAKVGRIVKDGMVKRLTNELKEHPTFFVASVGRLSAPETDTLRKQLRGTQSSLLMMKRRLGLQGLSALKIGGMDQFFEGSVAFIFPGEDVVPIAKLLVEFGKGAEVEKITLRGAVVEGQILDQKSLQQLAKLPPKLQLIAELIGVIESPMQSLAMTIEAVLGEVPYVVEEASKAKPAEVAKPAESGS